LSQALNPALSEEDVFDDRILGGGRYVEKTLDASGRRRQDSTLPLADLVRMVAEHFGVVPEELSQPSKERRIAQAKAVICYVAVRQLKIKGVEVAELLGYSSTAATHAASRGGTIFADIPDLEEKVAISKL